MKGEKGEERRREGAGWGGGGGGPVFGERGISEESPDPEMNGQSNPFTITQRNTDGCCCKPAAGRAASETRAPRGAGGWCGRPRPGSGEKGDATAFRGGGEVHGKRGPKERAGG